MLKARSLLQEISRLCSFLTVLTNPLVRGLFLAKILLPEHGLGFADTLLPSIPPKVRNSPAPEMTERDGEENKQTNTHSQFLPLSLSSLEPNPITKSKRKP